MGSVVVAWGSRRQTVAHRPRCSATCRIPSAGTTTLLWQRGLHNSMKLWVMPSRTTPKRGVLWRVLTNRGPLEKEMATNSSTLAWRTPWATQKGKIIWHWRMSALVRSCPIVYWGRAEKWKWKLPLSHVATLRPHELPMEFSRPGYWSG